MTRSGDELKAELIRRLFGVEEKTPTTALGRLRRTAGAALRAGHLALGGRRVLDGGSSGGTIDVDSLAAIVARLGELKGIAMKAGQILSYVDLDLPDEVRAALSVLQTHAQPMSFARVRAVITNELGERAAVLLRQMEPTPLAAASIGQVHRARLEDGTVAAVKVQYPDIARALAADFGVARVAMGVATRVAGNFTPEAFMHEARDRILEECDYVHEARMQRRFAEALAGHPVLVVPAVHAAYSTPRVLTTTFAAGRGLDAWLAAAPASSERDRIGAALFEFYLGSLFRFGLFNGDPHPGNYVFLDDGRLALLDHGCVREFDPVTVQKMAQLTRAIVRDDGPALADAFAALGISPSGKGGFAATRALFRAFYGPMLVDRVQRVEPTVSGGMRQLLQSKRALLGVRLPGEFLFLLRIRFGLMSVLARIGASANWYRLEESFLPPSECLQVN